MGPSWDSPSHREASFRKDKLEQQRQQLSKPKLWRKLQVQKSTALGLVVPGANLQLEVRNVDSADQDLGPAYQTSKLHWEECLVTMLPKFDLYCVKNDEIPGTCVNYPFTLVAKVSRPLWNCARSTLASIEMLKMDELERFEYDLPSDSKKTWRLHQRGLGRHYNLIGSNGSKKTDADDEKKKSLVWKGSKHIIEQLEDYNPACHGNLKLLNENGTILAAWKQQRDSKVMGSIHVFEQARDVIPIEAIVVSCLCIAIVEKTTGVTWFGGM